MKKILIVLIILLAIVTINALNKDNCDHLSGSDYSACYLMQVKGI